MSSSWGGRKVARLRALVYATYPNVCRICRQAIDASLDPREPLGPSVGHVLPRSRGGTDDIINLRPEHLDCNVRLGARPQPSRESRLEPRFFDASTLGSSTPSLSSPGTPQKTL